MLTSRVMATCDCIARAKFSLAFPILAASMFCFALMSFKVMLAAAHAIVIHAKFHQAAAIGAGEHACRLDGLPGRALHN